MDRSADLMGGTSVLELLEHSVPKLPLDEWGQFIGRLFRTHRKVRVPVVWKSCCPLPVRRGTRREPEMEEVVCETLVGEFSEFQDFRKETHRVPLEKGEEIVVGPLARRHRGF